MMRVSTREGMQEGEKKLKKKRSQHKRGHAGGRKVRETEIACRRYTLRIRNKFRAIRWRSETGHGPHT